MRVAAIILAALVAVVAVAVAMAANSLEGPALIRVAAVTDIDRGGVQGAWINDRTGKRIGWAVTTCDDLGEDGPLGSGTAFCHGIYLFPKGRIHTTGTRKSRSSYVMAVTGGTGLYSNVGGALLVRATRLNPRTETLLFSLEP